MSDSEKQKMTARERQIARIEQLKAQLQKEEAKLRSQARKDRNAQLVSFGIFLDTFLKGKSKQIPEMEKMMRKYVAGKVLERCLAGLNRIMEEISSAQPKREISPEPPSQLPEAEAQEKNQGSA